MNNNQPLRTRQSLKRIFLGECLESWKSEYLFSYRLDILANSTPSPAVRALTTCVQGMADRHLKIMEGFLPVIHKNPENSVEIQQSVMDYPDRGFPNFENEGVGYERRAIVFLLKMMKLSQVTYQCLAGEADKFDFETASQIFSTISMDYKKQIQLWTCKDKDSTTFSRKFKCSGLISLDQW